MLGFVGVSSAPALGSLTRLDGPSGTLCAPNGALRIRRPDGRCVLRMTSAAPVNAAPAAGPEGERAVDVLVVGSGISGSSLAFSLHQKGIDVLMCESRDRVGGNVTSRNENGYTWEEGPNTFQPAPHIMRIAVDLGLKDELVLADHTLPRFVYWDGKLFALPMGPQDIPNFRLLSPLGAIRAGLGAMGFVLPNLSGKEESVKEFITRHLGAEVFAKMIDPFVSGVYAGDPTKLSMQSAFKKIKALETLGGTLGIVEGAIIRLGQRKREAPPFDPELPTYKGGSLGSFKRGLAMLPESAAKRLGSDRVLLEHSVSSIEYVPEQERYRVTLQQTDGDTKVILAKKVALTTPANATANILDSVLESAADLRNIVYPTVFSVTLAYKNEAFREPLRGFGNLIPRTMGVRTLGTIWSSCLFPGRCPQGETLLLSYIGGAQDPSIKSLTDAEVAQQVHEDIARILLKEGGVNEPYKVVGVRKWDRAIPQYNIGHNERIERFVHEAAEKCPGMYLGGNYISGVAFGDCVLWGVETAKEIERALSLVRPST
ncbi:Protoporphyrinogen oxidase, chloroplastic [Porphyridium purpureum]|uniref:Protoporphyrinogen oxidase n=1 Tax=Porphyridium purpureum TaxID=35688 RepID=A0A5J4YXT7_PORPP|nr:Protoporphyrinogen oxidase, chloroplastic [Porphyridium purpureum]|eukprot:POR5298..scf209_3